MVDKLRIYIGGLGSSVQEDDLKKTFTSPQLGTVDSVEIIRSKGRSFGYLEFVPVSDKGLAKLFSTVSLSLSRYNGCMWKGGRLKLEKAKEHYIFRLRREWTEDAELEIKSSSQSVDANESAHVLQKPKKDQDIDKLQLKLFFPKLRKIKPIPLKGTGKHKYSFQRVEIPPLPIHFCDCEEHSGPPVSAKRNTTNHLETDTYGVNEDELNMMKLVLNKLLEEDDTSKTVPNEAELTKEINKDITYADDLQVDDNEDEQESDEDNLVINIVGQRSKRVAVFEDWGQKTTATNQVNILLNIRWFCVYSFLIPYKPLVLTIFPAIHVQNSLVRETESFNRPIPKMHGNNKEKLLPDKKRKQSARENYSNDTVPSKRKVRKGGLNDSTDDPVAVNTQPTDTESGSIQLSRDVASSHKSTWKDIVIEKGTTAFHISDIMVDPNSDVETKPRSDRLSPAPCLNENDDQKDQSSQDKDLEKLSDVQSTKPSGSEDKSTRGPSWLQKSSWLQLVGGSNNSAFNIGQILPGVTFENQESQQFGNNDFLNSRNGEQHGFVSKDRNSPIEDIGKPQGKGNKDIYATPGNQNVDVLTNEQNHAGLDGEQPNSDSMQTVEEKNEVSAPMHGTNVLPNNRAVRDIVISETCPFMRNAASMKEWMKTKAALSGSHKKKGKGKEPVQD
ncbi:hypothetical protein DH2020_039577 [Rehmannia glutinosa]|uniref:RRM domain-containing protein n=1 Tax=Rehmannia glutinosa TaxID=99300 RepID=A0ABR0UWL7_REHGL